MSFISLTILGHFPRGQHYCGLHRISHPQHTTPCGIETALMACDIALAGQDVDMGVFVLRFLEGVG